MRRHALDSALPRRHARRGSLTGRSAGPGGWRRHPGRRSLLPLPVSWRRRLWVEAASANQRRPNVVGAAVTLQRGGAAAAGSRLTAVNAQPARRRESAEAAGLLARDAADWAVRHCVHLERPPNDVGHLLDYVTLFFPR